MPLSRQRPGTSTPPKEVSTVSIPARVSYPLGYFNLRPLSGKGIEEEIVLALKALGVQRDDVITITVVREKRGVGK